MAEQEIVSMFELEDSADVLYREANKFFAENIRRQFDDKLLASYSPNAFGDSIRRAYEGRLSGSKIHGLSYDTITIDEVPEYEYRVVMHPDMYRSLVQGNWSEGEEDG